jgi:hypothetical protein
LGEGLGLGWTALFLSWTLPRHRWACAVMENEWFAKALPNTYEWKFV